MLLFWILFNVFVIVMLALDLGVFNRRAHTVTFREALAWSAMWVALAIVFGMLALRAWLLAGRRLQPGTLGIVEIVASVALLVAILLT